RSIERPIQQHQSAIWERPIAIRAGEEGRFRGKIMQRGEAGAVGVQGEDLPAAEGAATGRRTEQGGVRNGQAGNGGGRKIDAVAELMKNVESTSVSTQAKDD